jgi:hypothetical protein
MNSNMDPIPVPAKAAAARPWAHKRPIGPPRGVSDDDCGTVEALVEEAQFGIVYRDYWKPTEEQLKTLNEGGFIELAQYTPQMMMHSMTVWEGPANG